MYLVTIGKYHCSKMLRLEKSVKLVLISIRTVFFLRSGTKVASDF